MKYIGDSLLGVSFSVKTPKPLDNRTVVNNVTELYSMPTDIAYEGMSVSNLEDGYIYMLVDKSNITNADGWVSSYKALQLVSCSQTEYSEWKANTNSDGLPIDSEKEYLHIDTYYYIYEDSIEDKSNYYVSQEQYISLQNLVNTKAASSDLVQLRNTVTTNHNTVVNDYLTKELASTTYINQDFIQNISENTLSEVLSRYITTETADSKYLTAENFGETDDTTKFSYVKTTDFEEYKGLTQETLDTKVTTNTDTTLKNVTVTSLNSTTGEQVTIKPTGVYFGSNRLATQEEVPQWVCISHDDYVTLRDNNALELDKYYLTYGEGADDSGYITQANLDFKFLSKEESKKYVEEQVASQLQAAINVENETLILL